MTFANNKKTFLSKLDKSKKGSVDDKVSPLLDLLNKESQYYTTSSCSGRVYLWKGSGKKNETHWLNVSHDFITDDFLAIDDTAAGIIWLRVEPLILHICCKDLAAATTLLDAARKVCKKSSLSSIRNKIIVEIRGSEFVELPLYNDGKLLFTDLNLLATLVNQKLEHILLTLEKLTEIIKKIK